MEMTAEPKKLTRSRDDRMVAGVAGGLGEYFDIDSTIVRILFALSVFFGVGSGLLIYFILMLVVPEEPLGEGAVEVIETVEAEEE
jgi:phage shock protein PspC (stress-responsive transcriptional regulator)